MYYSTYNPILCAAYHDFQFHSNLSTNGVQKDTFVNEVHPVPFFFLKLKKKKDFFK